MRYPSQEIKLRILVAYQLPQLILGLNYVLPLVLPFKQFALCQILISILQKSKFLPSVFHQFQLYFYTFIISLALLFDNSYAKSFALGVCLGLLSNAAQLKLQCQFKYIGMLNYYILISGYPIQYASIYTFAIISICRLFLFDDVKQSEVYPLNKGELDYFSPESRYLAVLGFFLTDITFFSSLYFLYQLETGQVILAMIILFFNDTVVTKIGSLMSKVTIPILIIELLLILQLIFQEVTLLVPIHIIVLILFTCKPFNSYYIHKRKLISPENQQLISCISSIIAGVLIF